jgi:hypothetical protein
MTPTDAEKRMAYVYRVNKNKSLEDWNEGRSKQWEAFSSDDQKKIKESIVFVSFATDSGLVNSPFDHVNEDPPLPDIRSEIDGQPYYFELGEITDEGLARGVNDSEKSGEITGGPFSQLDPLLKMVRGKCAKSYPTRGALVDLLLHYSKQYALERQVLESLQSYQSEITQLVNEGPFSRVWIYLNWRPGKVIWRATR